MEHALQAQPPTLSELDGDWEEMRSLGHRMIDDIFEYLQGIGDRKVWSPIPDSVKSSVNRPLPEEARDPEEVYNDFLSNVLPYNINNAHPRFWAWVHGSGTPYGMLADLLASGLNANVVIGEYMPRYVESQVLEWSKEMMGFPASAGGLLTSGASVANITALIVARNSVAESIRKKGLHNTPRLVAYGSAETHACVVKGMEVIGVGSEFFRKIPVNDDYTINISLLKEKIAQDRSLGMIPFCIIGNAGTVNTGATDDLEALSTVAKEHHAWLHVDGAFGAVPALLSEFASLRNGLQKADSLSFDFHKWMYMNYEVGCVLVRDAQKHRNAFATSVEYLTNHERGLAAGPESLSNYGMELSRGFKALKVWMCLQQTGLERYRAAIRRNIEQAQYLVSLIKQSSVLELLAPAPLSIVCFRYNSNNSRIADLNTMNRELLMQIHESGVAAPSYTVLGGRYAIRVAITNHRSRLQDFDALVRTVEKLGKELEDHLI